MAKQRTVFMCLQCGQGSPQWGGRCNACGEWNTLVEEVESATTASAARSSSRTLTQPQSISAVDSARFVAVPTGLPEIDRVLGGGFVAGSVSLLGGEPGIGKSTLLLQLLAGWPQRTLYVSAEESAQQVRLRAERLDAIRPELWLLPESSLPNIVRAIDELQPTLLV